MTKEWNEKYHDIALYNEEFTININLQPSLKIKKKNHTEE